MSRPVVLNNGVRGVPGDEGLPGPAGGIQSVVAGANVTVDDTDPANPVVAATGGGGGGVDTATIHAATSKTTPVDADEMLLLDSAASFGLKKLTWANLKAGIKAYYDAVTSTLTNKDLTSGTNTFPTLNQNTTGNAASATKLATARAINGVNFDGTAAITVADATKVPTTRNVAGKPLSADVTIGFPDIATGLIQDDQQYVGAMIVAYCADGITWTDAAGTTLTGRPSARSDCAVVFTDLTPAGSATLPSWAIVSRDFMLKSPAGGGSGAPTPLLIWYGTGLANAHVIAAADAGSGDSPAVTSTGGSSAPTIVTGGAFSPAVSFAQAASQVCNLHYTVNSPAVLQGRARFWFQTPAAWYASSQGIFRFTDATDALLCGVTLRGSGTPGALSINDDTGANLSGAGTTPTNALTVSTWYRVELVIDQTGGGVARLYVFNTTGGLVFDSGNITAAVGTGGTWAKAIWGPTVSSQTTALKMADLKIMADPSTAVGPA